MAGEDVPSQVIETEAIVNASVGVWQEQYQLGGTLDQQAAQVAEKIEAVETTLRQAAEQAREAWAAAQPLISGITDYVNAGQGSSRGIETAASQAESILMRIQGGREIQNLVGEGQLTDAIQTHEFAAQQLVASMRAAHGAATGAVGAAASWANAADLLNALESLPDDILDIAGEQGRQAENLSTTRTSNPLQTRAEEVQELLGHAHQQLSQLPHS